jgi:outer membrane protein assembly factor BamC
MTLLHSRSPLIVALALLLGACTINTGTVVPDENVEYKREREAGRNLEIPPDLTSSSINDRMAIPGGTSYREFEGQQASARREQGSSAVLPETTGVDVRRDGDARWLVIQQPPELVWPKVVQFWQESGILLQEQNPAVGVMRTAWLENLRDIKSDFITDTLRSVVGGLYDAGTRDQYRVRLDRGTQSGTTELFLTHFGMEEQINAGTTGQGDVAVWVPTGRDPDLEAIMLRQIMVYLGESRERAEQLIAAGVKRETERARLSTSPQGSSLLIDEPFSRSWRLVGLALDRVGFAVEDRDRTGGIYYVRYNDPAAEAKEEGWLSKLAFWSSDDDIDKQNRYRVRVDSRGAGTEVTVQDEQGQRVDTPTAQRILTLLHEQLR